MLDNTWDYGVEPTKKPCYQPVDECTYLHVLGSLNIRNIVNFTNRTTSSDDFDAVHKVVIEDICGNMASLVQLGKYVAINAYDKSTMVYYVLKYLTET